MPDRWAVVAGGTVTNVILWDGQTPLDLGPGAELIPEADAAKLPRPTPPDVPPQAPDLDKLADAAEKATTVAQLRAVVSALIERT